MEEAVKPAELLAKLKSSNVRDIVLGMTAHEQLYMLRNIMEQEEDRRKEAQRKARAERKAAKELIDQQRN